MDDGWIIWSIAFVSLGGPVLALTLDRALGISGRLILFAYGLATVLALTAIGVYGAVDDEPVADLVIWGVCRRPRRDPGPGRRPAHRRSPEAFPLDMPQMFGAIALGIAPRL